MTPAPRIDRLTLDELHRHEGPPVGRETAIDQARDARVLEAGEQTPLPVEEIGARGCLGAEQLERDALFEARVAAVGGVDFAHATSPDQPIDDERANHSAALQRCVDVVRDGFEKQIGTSFEHPGQVGGREQRTHVARDGAGQAALDEQRFTLSGSELDEVVEPLGNARPVTRRHPTHRSGLAEIARLDSRISIGRHLKVCKYSLSADLAKPEA